DIAIGAPSLQATTHSFWNASLSRLPRSSSRPSTVAVPRRNPSVAFLARRGEEVRLLYTRPDRIDMGAGMQLIDAAKATGIGALELWCFQANERARRFYEARGFHAIRFTEGAQNEEQIPDIRYRWDWRRPASNTRGNSEPGLGGGVKSLRGFGPAGSTRVSKGVQPPLIALEGL